MVCIIFIKKGTKKGITAYAYTSLFLCSVYLSYLSNCQKILLIIYIFMYNNLLN